MMSYQKQFFLKVSHKIIGCVVMSVLSGGSISWAASINATPVSRYQTVPVGPRLEQIDLLQQRRQVIFPRWIKTVGQAMVYVLRYSGYHLAPADQWSDPFAELLQQPLPLVDRRLGPMTLQQALNTLAGPHFEILVNPVQRSIHYRLRAPQSLRQGAL